MKKKIVGIFVCMLLIVSAIIPATGIAYIEAKNIDKIANEKIMEKYSDFAPGKFFVKFSEGLTVSLTLLGNIMTTGISSIDSLNREFGVQDIEETFLSVIKKPKNPELFESIGLDRIYTFKVDEEIDILDAVEAYDNDPHVEYAEPNHYHYVDIIPNDPSFNLQWGLHNTGQTGGTPDADIDAPEAWDIEIGDSSILIAIIDSGIDYNHPDLSGNYVSGGINWLSPGNPPMDDNGHGTHCAGIAAAVMNNSIGIAGVAQVKVMAEKVLNKYAGGGTEENIAKAIGHAANNSADVISMSFGTYSYPLPTEEAAINYAYGLGCVLVASMGNHNSSSPRYPAAFDKTIAVGATNENDDRADSSDWGTGYGSNYGSHIDVVAPGCWIYSTLLSNKYGYDNGTSMSTPMVAGLAALLLSRDPTLTNDQIRKIIHKYAEDQVGDPAEDTPGRDDYYGYGRINAYEAVKNPINTNTLLMRPLERLIERFPLLEQILASRPILYKLLNL